jgi:hypothetical protein
MMLQCKLTWYASCTSIFSPLRIESNGPALRTGGHEEEPIP